MRVKTLRCEGRQSKTQFAAWIYVSGRVSGKAWTLGRFLFIKLILSCLRTVALLWWMSLDTKLLWEDNLTMKQMRYFSENVEHDTFPKKKPFDWENRNNSKTDFCVLLHLCSHSPVPPVLPPWATSNQPAKPSSLREKMSCARRMEKGRREQAACVLNSRVLRVWLQCEGQFSEASKDHIAGTRLLHQAGQLMKVNQCSWRALQAPGILSEML